MGAMVLIKFGGGYFAAIEWILVDLCLGSPLLAALNQKMGTPIQIDDQTWIVPLK